MLKTKPKQARLLPYQSPLEAHPDHVRAIGMISIEMANLDYMLGGFLGALLHIDEEIARTVYLTPRVAIGRVEIIENVIHYSVQPETELFERVDGIKKRVRALIGKRHRMIHDYWGVDIKTKMPSRMAIPEKSSKPTKLVALDELTMMIRDIRVLATDTRALTLALYQSWPAYASLDKSGRPRRGGRSKAKNHSKDHPPASALPPRPSEE